MLKKMPIGDTIIELSEIDSTNNYAMRLISEGMAEHGMVIRADFQTDGKGQLGNTWHSEERKNLLLSVILDTTGFSLEKQFYLNAMACLSVADALMTNYTLRDISIKWPNDIYAGNKKLAGILIENNLRGNAWTNAIIGIGINVNQVNFPDLNRATSIRNETNQEIKMNGLIKHLFRSINKFYDIFNHKNESLFEFYNQMLYMRNKEILFQKRYEIFRGILKGVSTEGLIEIQVENKLKRFMHKEIELMLE